jgi:hypothetical protein
MSANWRTQSEHAIALGLTEEILPEDLQWPTRGAIRGTSQERDIAHTS